MPSIPPVVPAYAYKCVDHSPLVKPFCVHVVRWFVAWLPVGVPANLITLGSSGCMWLMLVLTLGMGESRLIAPVCFILMAGYVIYDHADGMHARRTGTSGPLGEYLDHFLDVFHGPIALVAIFLICDQELSGWLAPVVFAVSLAGAATMVEEKERGELYFGFPGPLEAMLLVGGFFAVSCVPDVRTWWQAPLYGQTTIFTAIMAAGTVGSLFTALSCLRRIGRVPIEFAAFALSSALLGWQTAVAEVPWWLAPLAITLHGADYTGRTITSHLLHAKRPWPDLIAPVGAVVAGLAVFPPAGSMAAVVVYLLARNFRAIFHTLFTLRGYWRWWNAHLYPLQPAAATPAIRPDPVIGGAAEVRSDESG